MRRLLFLMLMVGLPLSVGCKEEKVIAPAAVPEAPKGPPIGGAKGGDRPGGASEVPKTSAPPISP